MQLNGSRSTYQNLHQSAYESWEDALRKSVATLGTWLVQARRDREALSRGPLCFDELGWVFRCC